MIIEGIIIFFFIYMVVYTLITIVSTFYSILKLNEEMTYRRFIQDLSFEELYPPISILVPAYNEEPTILRTLDSLMKLDYPHYEIIVVNDGSSDKTLQKVLEAYHLKETQRFVKEYVKTQPIKKIYERQIGRVNLVLVDKENGGKSDGLNAGINLSSHDLFLSMDADSILQKNSLKNIVKPYMRFDNVVAVGGSVKISNRLALEDDGSVLEVKLAKNPWLVFQTLEYFRAFLTTRIWFNRFNGNLIISGAFGLFDRNAVIRVGGYTHDTIGEDMDLIVKLHSYFLKNKQDYRIEYNAKAICWTQGPSNYRDLRTQRIRWHKGLIQSMMSHRYIFLNPNYGFVSFFSYMYFLFYELLTPIFIFFAMLFSIFLFLKKWIDFKFVIFFLLAYLTYIVINSWATLYLERYFFEYKISFKERMKLVLYCILENMGFRQLNLFFKLEALLTFHKDASWGSIQRYDEEE